MIWTFLDMNSGGARKTAHDLYVLRAPSREAAIQAFTAHTGRDPDHVTCWYCGRDYAVREHDSEAEVSEYAEAVHETPHWIGDAEAP